MNMVPFLWAPSLGKEGPREPGLESPANWAQQKNKHKKQKKQNKGSHFVKKMRFGEVVQVPGKLKKKEIVIFLKINWLCS